MMLRAVAAVAVLVEGRREKKKEEKKSRLRAAVRIFGLPLRGP